MGSNAKIWQTSALYHVLSIARRFYYVYRIFLPNMNLHWHENIPPRPIYYGDNIFDVHPLEAIPLDLDSEEDSAIIKWFKFYDSKLLINTPSGQSRTRACPGPHVYNSLPHSVHGISPYHYPKNIYIYTDDPDLPTFRFDLLINPISLHGHFKLAKNAGGSDSRLVCVVILYAWNCLSVGKTVGFCFSVSQCDVYVFAGWVIFSLESQLNGSRVGTVEGLLKQLQSNVSNPIMISSYA